MTVLLQISMRMWQWRNFENLLVFDECVDYMYVGLLFWPTLYIYCHSVSGNSLRSVVSGDYMFYSLCRYSSKMRVFPFDRYIFRTKFRHRGSDKTCTARSTSSPSPVSSNKKLSYCWETVRRESMPSIAEMDVEMTNYRLKWPLNVLQGHQKWHQSKVSVWFPISCL